MSGFVVRPDSPVATGLRRSPRRRRAPVDATPSDISNSNSNSDSSLRARLPAKKSEPIEPRIGPHTTAQVDLLEVAAEPIERPHVEVKQEEDSDARERRRAVAPGSLVMTAKQTGGGLVFLGGRRTAKDATWFKQAQIGAVLNVTDEVPCFFDKDAKREAAGLQPLVYMRVRVTDAMDQQLVDGPKNHWQDILDFFTDQVIVNKRNTLVHCSEGRSRSVTAVTALAMHHRDISLQKAYDDVRRDHPIADVSNNLGFQLQLQAFELRTRGNNTLVFLGSRRDRRSRAARSSGSPELPGSDGKVSERPRPQTKPATSGTGRRTSSKGVRRRPEKSRGVAQRSVEKSTKPQPVAELHGEEGREELPVQPREQQPARGPSLSKQMRDIVETTRDVQKSANRTRRSQERPAPGGGIPTPED
jgi:Dual specificity phosphatase, catalytic domain